MALQGSGAISIDNIRTELGQAQANSSLRSLSALASKSSPDAMSEFYGYSAVTYTEIEVEVFADLGPLCAAYPGDSVVVVYSRAYSTVVAGDTLYADTSGTLYNGANKYLKNSNGNGNRVNARGEVGAQEICD